MMKRWLDALFENFDAGLIWRDAGTYKMIPPPNSVTFPICAGCRRIIWEWPHFEEKVPNTAICDSCGEEN